MPQGSQTFAVGGGLDQVSPAIAVSPGRLRAAMNYESLAEGYGSVEGYERFDGRQAPSATLFWTLPFDAGLEPIVAGNTITGGISGATAYVLLDPVDPTGSWAADTAAGTLVLVNLTGEFQNNEPLIVGAVVKATSAGVATLQGADTEARLAQWTELAQSWRRALIAKVPGEGAVNGCFVYRGDIYAIRNAIGGAYAAIWKATAIGWAATPQTRILYFTGGLVEIEEGNVITGATTGFTAYVERVVRQSGDWGSTAAGYLILTAQTGAFVAEGLKVGATAVASAGGNSAVYNLPAGGRYMFKAHNFYGSKNLFRIYGVNGVGPAFEFDGEVICPIFTGTPIDNPTHVGEIGNHLVLGFRGGSVQTSSDDNPLRFDGELGAAEFGIGTDITDFQQATETALAIFGAEKICVLTGTDVDTYQMETLTEDAGAEPWTAQKVGQTMYLDRRGLRNLQSTSAFGNFKTGTLTELVEPLLRAKRKASARPIMSFVVKSKSHYRLVWDDGTGISIYMGRKYPEILPFEFGDMRPVSIATGELNDYTEGVFVGAEDGYVYRLDSGTSQDGEPIRGFLLFPFNHLGSPQINKRYHSVGVELEAAPQTNLGLLAQFDYGDGDKPIDGNTNFFVVGGPSNDFRVTGGGGNWDVSNWDEFFWSAPFEGEATARIAGIGRNISLLVASRRTAIEPRHIIRTYSIAYSNRGMRKEIIR